MHREFSRNVLFSPYYCSIVQLFSFSTCALRPGRLKQDKMLEQRAEWVLFVWREKDLMG